jgi:Holliday junction resolvase-like predicted endonuclease
MKITDARMKKLQQMVGGISNNNGEFAEEYFANALEEKKVFAGVQFDDFDRKVKARMGNLRDEFDIVLYNGDAVAIIEVKYKVHLNDVEKMVTQKVPNFRALFPYYANHKIYLGIGSLAFYDDVITKAKELGIGILRQKGETIEAEPGTVKAY